MQYAILFVGFSFAFCVISCVPVPDDETLLRLKRHGSGGHQPAGHQSPGTLVVTKSKKKTKITSGLSNGSKSESSILDVNLDPSIGAHVDLGLNAANDFLAGGDSNKPFVSTDLLELSKWLLPVVKQIGDLPADTLRPVGDVLLGEVEGKLEDDPEPIVIPASHSAGHPAPAGIDVGSLLKFASGLLDVKH